MIPISFKLSPSGRDGEESFHQGQKEKSKNSEESLPQTSQQPLAFQFVKTRSMTEGHEQTSDIFWLREGPLNLSPGTSADSPSSASNHQWFRYNHPEKSSVEERAWWLHTVPTFPKLSKEEHSCGCLLEHVLEEPTVNCNFYWSMALLFWEARLLCPILSALVIPTHRFSLAQVRSPSWPQVAPPVPALSSAAFTDYLPQASGAFCLKIQRRWNCSAFSLWFSFTGRECLDLRKFCFSSLLQKSS